MRAIDKAVGWSQIVSVLNRMQRLKRMAIWIPFYLLKCRQICHPWANKSRK